MAVLLPKTTQKNSSSDFDAIFSLKFHVVTRWNNGNLIWYLTNFFCWFIAKPIADRMRLSIVWAALFNWWKNRKLIIQVFCIMTSRCYLSGVLRQKMKNTFRIENRERDFFEKRFTAQLWLRNKKSSSSTLSLFNLSDREKKKDLCCLVFTLLFDQNKLI